MGGGSDDAQQQADANERERQAQITAATGNVNKVFDDPARQAQVDKLSSDTTKFYTDDLNQQQAKNALQLKFALARGGQTGGSVQADQGQKLGEDYLKGVVEASRRGQAAGADLKASDEQARVNLLAMAQSGLDATTASSRATSALQNDLESSQASSTSSALGNSFADLSDVYQRSQDAKALRQGQKYDYGTLYKGLYGPAGGYSG